MVVVLANFASTRTSRRGLRLTERRQPSHQRVKDILYEATLLPKEEREGFVARASDGDARLFAEVISLLSYYDGLPSEPDEEGRGPSSPRPR